jgi:hypothetical protein
MAKAMQSGDMFLLTNISSRDNFIEKDSKVFDRFCNYIFELTTTTVAAVM